MSKFIKKYYPLIILFFIVLIFNIFMNIKDADFIWFLDQAKTSDLFDYLGFRYFNWTSRLVIEFVLVGILKLNYEIVFRVINTFVMFLIPCILLKIFSKNKDTKSQWIIVLLYLCYNFKHMSSAGWYATLINYMWPIFCLLVSLLPIRNYIDNKKDRWYMYIFYILSLIYACNQEQSCAILFGVYLLFLIYTIINKKISKFSVISLIISLSSLIFILTCPGNALRSVSETMVNYPEYANFDFVQKIGLSFTTIMTEYITSFNFIIFILSLLLLIIIFKEYKNVLIRIISVIPVLIIFVINYLFRYLLKVFPILGRIRNIFLEENIKRYVLNKPKLLLLTGISIIFISLIIYLIIKVLNEKNKINIKNIINKYYMIIIFLIGLASRLIIGFSSSIFASGFRTNIFFDFSLIAIIILLLNKYENYLKNTKKYIIIILLIISIINIASIYMIL